jgi:hypothetical protein
VEKRRIDLDGAGARVVNVALILQGIREGAAKRRNNKQSSNLFNFQQVTWLAEALGWTAGRGVVESFPAAMFCPQCKAEYRQGFTRCADCDVELVYELPARAIVPLETVDPGNQEEDPFCSFWKGDDPRVHAELCELLGEQGIPHKTIRRQDHLFNWNTSSAFEIGVPFSQFDRAEAVVKDAYGGENEPVSEEVRVRLELTEFVGPSESRPAWDPERWYPEDATVEIWEGDQQEMGELLAASLGENHIHARVTETKGAHGLFVLPGNETRAREIVREVVEGVPPE